MWWIWKFCANFDDKVENFLKRFCLIYRLIQVIWNLLSLKYLSKLLSHIYFCLSQFWKHSQESIATRLIVLGPNTWRIQRAYNLRIRLFALFCFAASVQKVQKLLTEQYIVLFGRRVWVQVNGVIMLAFQCYLIHFPLTSASVNCQPNNPKVNWQVNQVEPLLYKRKIIGGELIGPLLLALENSSSFGYWLE